jgi:hypothetical protein
MFFKAARIACLSCLILGLVIRCLHVLLTVWPVTPQQVFTDSVRVSKLHVLLTVWPATSQQVFTDSVRVSKTSRYALLYVHLLIVQFAASE